MSERKRSGLDFMFRVYSPRFPVFYVYLLKGALERHGEKQDGVVNWWLRAGVEDDLGDLLGFIEVGEVVKEIFHVGIHG